MVLLQSSGRPQFFPRIPIISNKILYKLLNNVFVRIEIRTFLKFLRIEISDGSRGFSLAPDGYTDQNLRMTEVGCTTTRYKIYTKIANPCLKLFS